MKNCSVVESQRSRITLNTWKIKKQLHDKEMQLRYEFEQKDNIEGNKI